MIKKRNIKTPSQTVGPFFGRYIKFNFKDQFFLNKKTIKYSSVLNLNVRDKNNKVVKDGFIEYWQIKNNRNLMYFNRINYNNNKSSFIITFKEYDFNTYIYITIFARGLLNHLHTIVFFEDQNLLQNDNTFNKLPKRRSKYMIAKFKQYKNNTKYYNHDLYLNGDREAIFFEYN